MKREEQAELIKNAPKVKKYGKDLGKRGIYDIRNPLNDLTGKEWTHFTNSILETDFSSNEDELELWRFLQESVIPTCYSTNGKNSVGHKLRKAHPSPKPPMLMKDIIKFFTKADGWILDPFVGVGGTLLGASLCDPIRNAVGIDLEENYLKIYKKVTKQEGLKEQIVIKGDARKAHIIPDVFSREFDLILTDPPYANMLSKKRTGGDRKDKGNFTDDDRDLGNIDYEEFLEEFRRIIEKTLEFLKNKGYVIIFCKDIQPSKKHHNLLHADIVQELIKIPSLRFKGYKIWYDKSINLYPYGYPFSFVANQLHQYILVFRKEDE